LDVTNEKPIQKGFDVVTPKLVSMFGNKTTYFPTQKLARPHKTPDGILGMPGTTKASWMEMVIPFEYKKNQNEREGMGQVVSYGAIALEQQAALYRKSIPCVFTDWNSIVVLIFHDGKYFQTSCMELFVKLHADSGPSEGFKWLCRLLNGTPEELAYKYVPKLVLVDDIQYPVISVLGQGADNIVYECEYNGERVAVKKAMYSYSSKLHELHTEALTIEEVRNLLPRHQCIYLISATLGNEQCYSLL
jgi:hypothetical protein